VPSPNFSSAKPIRWKSWRYGWAEAGEEDKGRSERPEIRTERL